MEGLLSKEHWKGNNNDVTYGITCLYMRIGLAGTPYKVKVSSTVEKGDTIRIVVQFLSFIAEKLDFYIYALNRRLIKN